MGKVKDEGWIMKDELGYVARWVKEMDVCLYGDAMRPTSRLVLGAWDGQSQGWGRDMQYAEKCVGEYVAQGF